MVGTQAGRLKIKTGRPMTIIGAALAVVALILFVVLGQPHGGPATAGTVPVVVAAQDLPSRSPIKAADVTVVKFAPGDVPPGSFTAATSVQGLVPAVAIAKGQALTSNLLVKSPDQVSGAEAAYLPIPSGFVAMTIPTSEQQGVAGYVQPGDYISIIAVAGSNVRTVFTDVHVLRVGPANSASAGSGAPGQAPAYAGVSSSLTIVITECQAEYFKWFLSNTTLTYTLESFKDYRPQGTGADPSCPSVASAHGVNRADIQARYPGLLP